MSVSVERQNLFSDVVLDKVQRLATCRVVSVEERLAAVRSVDKMISTYKIFSNILQKFWFVLLKFIQFVKNSSSVMNSCLCECNSLTDFSGVLH